MYEITKFDNNLFPTRITQDLFVENPAQFVISQTEKEIAKEMQKFRSSYLDGLTSEKKYHSLIKDVSDKWKECNEITMQKNWQKEAFVFRPTNKTMGIPLELHELIVKDRKDAGIFMKNIYMWIVEASAEGDRLPSNKEIEKYVRIFAEIRHHFEHDREHGKKPNVKKKYSKIARIFNELIEKQPISPIDWHLFQIAILLRVNALLELTLKTIESS